MTGSARLDGHGMAGTGGRRMRTGDARSRGWIRRNGRRTEDGGDGSMTGRGCCSPPAGGSTTAGAKRSGAGGSTTAGAKTEWWLLLLRLYLLGNGFGDEDAAPRSKMKLPGAAQRATGRVEDRIEPYSSDSMLGIEEGKERMN